MPRKYTRRARKAPARKRAPYRRRAKYGRKKYAIQRTLFPPFARTRLKYCMQMTVTQAVSGVAQTYYFRANSIFDPDLTGGGHQPYLHDEWALAYDHYKVVSSMIKIDVFPAGTTGADGVVAGIKLNDDTFSNVDPSLLMEENMSKWGVCSSRDGPKGLTLIKKFKSNIQFKGRNAEDVSAPFGTNPADGAFYTFWLSGLNTTVAASGVNCVVTIWYDCLMTERKDIAQS